jgi:hypothetical protein
MPGASCAGSSQEVDMSARDPSGAGEKSSTRLIASNGFGMFMLGIALALGGAFASQSVAKAIITSRSASSIKVKGSASIDLRADSARWVTTVTCRGTTLQAAYASLSKDMQRLQQFMTTNTFTETEAKTGPVASSTLMGKDAKGNNTNKIEFYQLTQTMEVLSPKVEAVATAARNVTQLIQDGVDVASGQPAYLVSSLDSTKVDLLDKATRSAMERAETLARGSGSSVGALVSANQGVIQVVERGTTGSSDYGEYDTRTIEKTLRAVVSLEYAVR